MTFAEGRSPSFPRAGVEAPLNRVVVLCVFALCVAMLSVVVFLPRGPFVIVVTDPARPPQEAVSVITAADGMFVASGSRPWVTLAYSDVPNFPARLMKAGAWLVLNSTANAVCSKDT